MSGQFISHRRLNHPVVRIGAHRRRSRARRSHVIGVQMVSVSSEPALPIDDAEDASQGMAWRRMSRYLWGTRWQRSTSERNHATRGSEGADLGRAGRAGRGWVLLARSGTAMIG